MQFAKIRNMHFLASTFLLATLVRSETSSCPKEQTSATPCDAEAKSSLVRLLDDNVVVLTIATEVKDGYERYLRSAKVYDVPVKTLGMGAKWTGGNMNFAGGGQKINLLKNELERLKESGKSDEKIILFTDSYDVMFLAGVSKIVEKFKKFPDTRVLFAAEQYCWPSESLIPEYPKIGDKGNPYLNSGGFIGYFDEVYEIVNHKQVDDKYDDQLYYTTIYLDKELREKLKISLDHNSEIFQNLNGAYNEIELVVNETETFPYIKNVHYETTPLIVHGNGPSKAVFNSLSTYLANAWSPTLGCLACEERKRSLDPENLPTVLLELFIEQGTPFIEEFFAKVGGLSYPKSKMHLYVRNNVPFHAKDVEKFLKEAEGYASVKQVAPEDDFEESHARKLGVEMAILKKCDYIFSVDSIAHLDNPNTLVELIGANVSVVAPLLARPGKSWSNFWGALTTDGFYARSVDYMDIVHLVRRGIWNVPFINSCYLVNTSAIAAHVKKPLYKGENLDPDMKFCSMMRELEIFMHVSNLDDYGHLIDPETFDPSLTNPDVYQLFQNQHDWERRYLHPNYTENFNVNRTPSQPCPDVYWFPLTTMRFCKEFIEMAEAFGRWSDGTNYDERLDGGYEAVPTRDIHMNQINFERHWLHFLQLYVRPLQELVFLGYVHDPPRSVMNFIVRYKPDEQPSLRPHHDSSTYTINLALNTPNEDYKGGGCRFIRYNCSVVDTRPGWLLIHPGRLTHYHEGLLVTEGIRYIMISFVDP